MQLISSKTPTLGTWVADTAGTTSGITDDNQSINDVLAAVHLPIQIIAKNDRIMTVTGGCAHIGRQPENDENALLLYLPPRHPQALGDVRFCQEHNVDLPYIAGAMARGITSTEMVIAMSRAHLLSFYGAAGLSLDVIENGIITIKDAVGNGPFGCNLIHAPSEQAIEWGTVDLYLKHGIRNVSASAFLKITPSLVAYRLAGIHRKNDGTIVCPNKLFAKVSRREVAASFMAPAPEKMVLQLIEEGRLPEDALALSRDLPMAADITAEADSGGHTDNRPALCLFPDLVQLREKIVGDRYCVRIGLGGGIGSPQAAAAAFMMGAAYIVTGSINQACVEAGTSERVKALLAKTEVHDVASAPAADMFEMGVKVQVLKRGSLFAIQGNKLHDLYRRYDRFSDLPLVDQKFVEERVLRESFTAAWQATKAYFTDRNPALIAQADQNEKKKMALVFRSYLGRGSSWAQAGTEDRQNDFQIWCGPAMGSFNTWTQDTFLAEPKNRRVVTVAYNIMHGAAIAMRINDMRPNNCYPRAQPSFNSQVALQPRPHDVVESYLTQSFETGNWPHAARIGIAGTHPQLRVQK